MSAGELPANSWPKISKNKVPSSFPNCREEFLIDFGDLYGDAVTEIRKTGLNVLQIKLDGDMKTLITQILDAIGDPYLSDPVFFAAKRPADFNTKIKIKGFLITKTKGSRVLISATPLHNRVLQFFNENSVKVVLAGLL